MYILHTTYTDTEHRVWRPLFWKWFTLSISHVSNMMYYFTPWIRRWKMKSNECLKGSMVMQDVAIGHLTIPSCKMWRFHFSYLCPDRIWCIWDYITSDAACVAQLYMFRKVCEWCSQWSVISEVGFCFVVYMFCSSRDEQRDLGGWAPGLICLC